MAQIFEHCKFCGGKILEINSSLQLVECTECSLIFSKRKYSQKEFQEVYDRLYNAEDPKYKTHSIVEYEQLKKGIIRVGYNRKRLIKKYMRDNTRILEIGSGIGLIGCFIRQIFPQSTFTGVEIDEKIQQKSQSLGLNVHQGDFSIIRNLQEKFDTVLMWEVLEHIQDLQMCLELIKEKLMKGGLFIFSVPNYDKRLNYTSPEDKIYQDGPPIHLNFFRKQTIYNIFNSNDFEIIECSKKKMPYLNWNSFFQMGFKILLGKYQGPTLFCIARRK